MWISLVLWICLAPPVAPELGPWDCMRETDGHAGLLCAGVCFIPFDEGTPPEGKCRKAVAVHQVPDPERGEQELRRLCKSIPRQRRCLDGSNP